MPRGVYKRVLKDPVERFWAYVEINPGQCWGWKASPGNHGYGQFRANGRKRTAHTFSWALHFGKIPHGLCVLHKCDVRTCTNPEHLFLGTRTENMEDMTRKGRRVRGETHGMRKLSEFQALEILASDSPTTELAKFFNVSSATIRLIRNGKRWSYLSGEAHA